MVKLVKRQLSEIIIEGKLLTEEQLEQALEVQGKEGGRLSQILIRLGYVDERKLTACLGEQLGLPLINLERFRMDPEIVSIIPEQVARHYQLISLSRLNKTLTVAMADPLNVLAMDDIKLLTGYNLTPIISTEKEIEKAINQYYSGNNLEVLLQGVGEEKVELVEKVEEDIREADVLRAVEDTPIVRAVNLILAEAVKQKASDILVEPGEETMRIRYRVDGILYEVPSPPKSMHMALVSRVKVVSELDIAERRLPQDGRFRISLEGREIDFRVSVIPSTFGEKVAIRVLDKSALKLDIDELGFEEEPLQELKKCSRRPHGMILVCGPTGCGKTTTLYSILKYVNDPGLNLVTVEDPVEYELAGINQVTVKNQMGLTFSNVLRSILRQDPDVIMVGEMRDYETLDVGIKAALTGHLMLSSLHTTTAPGAIVRLIDMGAEPFLIASSVIMVTAQRLMRKVCPECKESYTASPEIIRKLDLSLPEGRKEVVFSRGKGCKQCNNTGYRGRIGIIEVLPLRPEMKELIMTRVSTNQVKNLARKLGMRTLRENGLEKVLAGQTTVEEVLRVTGEYEG
ncbi:MAG: Flp pilus assembly complex ATPase component [Nitrospirae bacterium]|nr:Flp pilus assembly complex ATPase component [Nitrospirota bacterium]